MTGEQKSESSPKSALRTAMPVMLTIGAGYVGLKLTFWFLKLALLTACVGGVGYLGWRAVKLLTTRDTQAERVGKALPTPSGHCEPDATELFNEAMAELQELKRTRKD